MKQLGELHNKAVQLMIKIYNDSLGNVGRAQGERQARLIRVLEALLKFKSEKVQREINDFSKLKLIKNLLHFEKSNPKILQFLNKTFFNLVFSKSTFDKLQSSKIQSTKLESRKDLSVKSKLTKFFDSNSLS